MNELIFLGHGSHIRFPWTEKIIVVFLQFAIEVCTYLQSYRYTFFSLSQHLATAIFFLQAAYVIVDNICNKYYINGIVEWFWIDYVPFCENPMNKKATKPILKKLIKIKWKERESTNCSELKRIEHKMRICVQNECKKGKNRKRANSAQLN